MLRFEYGISKETILQQIIEWVDVRYVVPALPVLFYFSDDISYYMFNFLNYDAFAEMIHLSLDFNNEKWVATLMLDGKGLIHCWYGAAAEINVIPTVVSAKIIGSC